jgi:hypothetical protein
MEIVKNVDGVHNTPHPTTESWESGLAKKCRIWIEWRYYEMKNCGRSPQLEMIKAGMVILIKKNVIWVPTFYAKDRWGHEKSFKGDVLLMR